MRLSSTFYYSYTIFRRNHNYDKGLQKSGRAKLKTQVDRTDQSDRTDRTDLLLLNKGQFHKRMWTKWAKDACGIHDLFCVK